MTTPRVVIRPAAARDIDDQADYLAQRSEQLAHRFLEAVDRTIQDVARMPGMGASYPLTNPRLRGLRSGPVGGFKKHLIST